MRKKIQFILFLIAFFPVITNAEDEQLHQQIQLLQKQTAAMQAQLEALQKKLAQPAETPKKEPQMSVTTPVASTVKKEPVPVPLANQPPAPSKPNAKSKASSKVTAHSVPTSRGYEEKSEQLPSKKHKTSPVTKRAEQQAVLTKATEKHQVNPAPVFHTSTVSVHTLNDADPESIDFYPTALVADNHVLAYIAGTPVVSSPFLGARPAFDGSDYIVNISSINRDVRLMQQRRSLHRAYEKLGYPMPERPIFALSGKVEPIGTIGQPYFGPSRGDWNLGSDELDLTVILNSKVEAYMGLAYNAAPPNNGGQRVANSSVGLNMGFVNIGDLDQTPFYITAGQLFAPFGRFSTSMVSATLPMMLARVKARPIILGYKSQDSTGIFAAIYGFRGDTTLGTTGVGGANLGYILDAFRSTTEIGVSYISSINDAGGMQYTGSVAGTTFGGFASITNGSENVHKVSAIDAHLTTSWDRYNITLEWISALGRFRPQDLSFNGVGALPQAIQAEGGITFMLFNKPSSVAASYQWATQTLALNIPRQRMNAVYNISIWKDTVESLEYRHDIDYNQSQFGNGAAPTGVTNANTFGTGGKADTLLAQIGIYF